MIKRCDLRLPTRLYHGGGIFFCNDGGARDLITDAQIFAHKQTRIPPARFAIRSRREHSHCCTLGHIANRIDRLRPFNRCIALDDGLYRNRFHHQGLACHQKSKTLAVSRFKSLRDFRQGTHGHHERRVTAFIPNVNALMQFNGIAQSLLRQSQACSFTQSLQGRQQRRHALWRQAQLHSLLTNQTLIGQAHAVG